MRSDETNSLWKGSDYGKWFVADTCTTISESMQGFFMPLIAQALTGSPSTAVLLESLNKWIVTGLRIPGGMIQDQADRKKLLMIEGVVGCLVFVLLGVAGYSGSAGLWVLLLAVVVLAVRDGLLGSTTNVMLRGIVPDHQLPKAMAANSARDSTCDILGGPLASILMQVSQWLPCVVCGVCELMQTVFTSRITRYWKKDGDGSQPRRQSSRELWKRAFDGIIWLLKDDFQRRSVFSSAMTSACFNSILLIAVLQQADNDGYLSASTLGVSISLGILVGSLFASRVVDRVNGGILILLYFLLMGVGSLGAALSGPLWLRCAFLFIALIMLPCGNAVGGGFSALLYSKEYMGRIFAGIALLESGLAALVTFLSGLAVHYWGTKATCIALAICVVVFSLPYLTYRGVLGLPKPDQWEEYIKRVGYAKL